MKIQFTHQAYQAVAVEAVADCFAGQPKAEGVTYRLDPGKQGSHGRFLETGINLLLRGWNQSSEHFSRLWDITQRRRRLALVANNARFLILPGVDCLNLASRVLALCVQRLADDWQQSYGHPLLVAESFVDSQLFRGTCYKAQGWELLGGTKGNGRTRQDYHTTHNRPKQLWVPARR